MLKQMSPFNKFRKRCDVHIITEGGYKILQQSKRIMPYKFVLPVQSEFEEDELFETGMNESRVEGHLTDRYKSCI